MEESFFHNFLHLNGFYYVVALIFIVSTLKLVSCIFVSYVLHILCGIISIVQIDYKHFEHRILKSDTTHNPLSSGELPGGQVIYRVRVDQEAGGREGLQKSDMSQ